MQLTKRRKGKEELLAYSNKQNTRVARDVVVVVLAPPWSPSPEEEKSKTITKATTAIVWSFSLSLLPSPHWLWYIALVLQSIHIALNATTNKLAHRLGPRRCQLCLWLLHLIIMKTCRLILMASGDNHPACDHISTLTVKAIICLLHLRGMPLQGGKKWKGITVSVESLRPWYDAFHTK